MRLCTSGDSAERHAQFGGTETGSRSSARTFLRPGRR